MIMVYIAGPYSSLTKEGVEENCAKARQVGADLVRACGPGVFPVIPHQLGRDIEDIGDYSYWIEGTLEIMRRCDAVLLVPGWERSRGAKAERAEATALGIPVVHTVEGLKDWLYFSQARMRS